MDPVADRHKAVLTVVSTSRRLAGFVARQLEDLLAPELEDSRPMPDFEYVQQLLCSALERRWQTLSGADEDLQDARSERHELVGRRAVDVGRLRRELIDLRNLLRGRFGARPSQSLIGVRGRTGRDPVVLLRQADRAVARLRDAERPLPPSKVPIAAGQRSRWARPVAQAAERLRATARALGEAFKRADLARTLRQRALEDFNQVFVRVAGFFEAIYLVIGRQDLAEKVRPARRRPGKTLLQDRPNRKSATTPPVDKPSATGRLVAPLRQILERRRSA